MLIFVFNLKNMWDQSWDFAIGEMSYIFETLLLFMTYGPTSADMASSGAKSGIQNGITTGDALIDQAQKLLLCFVLYQPDTNIADRA